MTAQEALARQRAVKLTIDDYLLLDRAGAFRDHRRTELIDGTVFAMNAQHSEHFRIKNRLYRRVADACDALARGIEAWSEGSIAIPPHDVPEPDIFITSAEPRVGLVPVATVLLVAEVASTTLDDDLGRKARLYAAAAIPEYWVIDVGAQRIHQLWAPANGAYQSRRVVPFGEHMTAMTIAGLGIDMAGL